MTKQADSTRIGDVTALSTAEASRRAENQHREARLREMLNLGPKSATIAAAPNARRLLITARDASASALV